MKCGEVRAGEGRSQQQWTLPIFDQSFAGTEPTMREYAMKNVKSIGNLRRVNDSPPPASIN